VLSRAGQPWSASARRRRAAGPRVVRAAPSRTANVTPDSTHAQHGDGSLPAGRGPSAPAAQPGQHRAPGQSAATPRSRTSGVTLFCLAVAARPQSSPSGRSVFQVMFRRSTPTPSSNSPPSRQQPARRSCAIWSRFDSFAARGWRRATVLRSPRRLLFVLPPGTNLLGINRRCSVRSTPLLPSL
jgi:hypothetical protein